MSCPYSRDTTNMHRHSLNSRVVVGRSVRNPDKPVNSQLSTADSLLIPPAAPVNENRRGGFCDRATRCYGARAPMMSGQAPHPPAPRQKSELYLHGRKFHPRAVFRKTNAWEDSTHLPTYAR